MLDAGNLERAVRLQRKAYALLGWFQGHLDQARFPKHEAHAAMGSVAVARAWLEANSFLLPAEVAPGPDEIDELGNMFASYLTTSFDLVEDPPYRIATATGCLCDVCSYLARCSTLRPKRLTGGDKAHAQRLKADALAQLAAEVGRALAESRLPELLADPATDERAALVAYAHQLLLRLAGDPGDPSILVLWRAFAWTRTGAPKRGYTLSSADILRAQSELLALLRDVSNDDS